ncbi:glycosyltransferase [Allosphingosinicella deserti]|uniref:Glycosyl transferase family 1 n=1 Tax=Allosphingosinicella deserti TaxID=2116704 RepID=A0A2P7QPS1_9SPHN|nr:glycosyltransferase [Sphingomonas deserti]PSJ39973.1 glycosyl transferase family 1 [Sphingomonas deserti]
MPPVRILHAHSTFALGGKEARAVRLMNAFGGSARHVVISGTPGETGARAELDPGIDVRFPDDAPPLSGAPVPTRFWQLARYIRAFDLVLTYNWGAMDMVMARRLFGGPPLVHHEDGFNQDESERLKPQRNAWRRIALPGAHRLVVPSRRLEDIARTHWRQKDDRVARIANGIETHRYAMAPEPGLLGLEAAPRRLVIGTVAGLRPVKNLPRLVRAFAAMGNREALLVIVGQGPESERILAEARQSGVVDRVMLPGFRTDPARWIGAFDIFALSSDSEQSPISLIEAMAAGLPAVTTAVGDIPAMVSAENRPLIVDSGDEAAFAAALDTLAERADLRRAIGLANREKANAEYDDAAMVGRYAALYGEAIGRPHAFVAERT